MSVEITDRPDVGRYEVTVDAHPVGFAEYRRDDGNVTFTHTEIDDAHEGQGVGSALAHQALDDVRARGLAVVPQCAFIAGWIDRHADYGDLVSR